MLRQARGSANNGITQYRSLRQNILSKNALKIPPQSPASGVELWAADKQTPQKGIVAMFLAATLAPS